MKNFLFGTIALMLFLNFATIRVDAFSRFPSVFDDIPEPTVSQELGQWLSVSGQNITDERFYTIVSSGGIPEDIVGFSFENNQISDLSLLLRFDYLQSLWLTNNNIDDLSPLKLMASLSYVDLSGNPVTYEQIEALQQALPNAEIVFRNDFQSTRFINNSDGEFSYNEAPQNLLLTRNGFNFQPLNVTTRVHESLSTGVGWEAGTQVTYRVSNGRITNISVVQFSSAGLLARATREGTTRQFPMVTNTTSFGVVSYFTVNATANPAWSTVRHTITLEADGSTWAWEMRNLFGSLPRLY